MKYVDEYRRPENIRQLRNAIHQLVSRPWTIMEVCGGQTHSILHHGIDQLLPAQVELIHGPGCPVCVTDISLIDQAIELALSQDTCLCTYGDMMRVPGSKESLLSARAQGAHIEIIYSPTDAVKIAQKHPDLNVVFFAVGFETTAPASVAAVLMAESLSLQNFYILASHVRVPPALETLMHNKDCRVQGFLAAGHVCTVMGYHEYHPLAQKYHVPIVVTGFEPLDIMEGIYLCIRQLEAGKHIVENQYRRCVREQGNLHAQEAIHNVLRVVDMPWRGMGLIPASGFSLNPHYAHRDASVLLAHSQTSCETKTNDPCQSGQVLQGIIKPPACPAFGTTCTPEHPLGAPMVSSEGACAAYHHYYADHHRERAHESR